MYLKKVQDYDKYSNEADIVVSDGKYDLLCYCYPAQCNKIGSIELSLDTHLPGDIKEGEFIEFDVIRLDCEIK